MRLLIIPILLVSLAFQTHGVQSQPAALIAADTPNDAGNSITLILPRATTVDTRYRVTFSETTNGPFELLAEVDGDLEAGADGTGCECRRNGPPAHLSTVLSPP